MTAKTRRLRELLDSGEFLYMPSAATPLEGRLAEAMGVPVVYTGGFDTLGKALVLEAGRTIMLEKEKLLARADELGVAIVGRS